MVENFVRKMCYNSAACRLQVSDWKPAATNQHNPIS